MIELLPYVMISIAAWISFSFLGGTCPSRAVLLCLCLWGGYEAVIGLMQLSGFAVSGHPGFAMTGSFDNPGPHGGFLSMCLAAGFAYIVSRYRSLFKGSLADMACDIVVTASSLLCLAVLPATMSRAGWMGLLAAIILYFTFGGQLRHRVATHVKSSVLILVASVALLAVIFFIKKDSAVGRLHIWRIECRAMADNWPAGAGAGKALGEYGQAQAEFFMEKERPAAVVRIAGCPEYAFNEYLCAGIEYGIAGLAAAILLPVCACRNLVRRHEPVGYALVSLSVFAFFSYPLDLWQFRVCLAAMLGAGFSLRNAPAGLPGRFALPVVAAVLVSVIAAGYLTYTYLRREKILEHEMTAAGQLTAMGLYDDAVGCLEPLRKDLVDNYRYLYALGYALHKAGRYSDSNAVLEAGAGISSDPMFHNIIGKNHEALQEYDMAEEEFMTAHYMVPSRLYPLCLLMDMYIGLGMHGEAVRVGRTISGMPVNPRNRNMVRLRDETEEKLDSLSTYYERGDVPDL